MLYFILFFFFKWTLINFNIKIKIARRNVQEIMSSFLSKVSLRKKESEIK